MTDYAALVGALYRHYGRLQGVADACNGVTLRHGPAYYWQIAHGRIRKLSEETRGGIERAPARAVRPLKGDFSNDTRKTAHPFSDDFNAGNAERNRLGLTWPEMQHLWRMAYFATLKMEATK